MFEGLFMYNVITFVNLLTKSTLEYILWCTPSLNAYAIYEEPLCLILSNRRLSIRSWPEGAMPGLQHHHHHHHRQAAVLQISGLAAECLLVNWSEYCQIVTERNVMTWPQQPASIQHHPGSLQTSNPLLRSTCCHNIWKEVWLCP